MCMIVYLASDVPLPTSEWEEARPGFHVRDVSETDTWLREILSKLHLYELGSHQGCGCGFQLSEDILNAEEPWDEETAEFHRSRRSLENYLTLALREQPEVELHTYWGSSPAFPSEPSRRERFTPLELTQARPRFMDEECLTVVRH